MNVKQFFKKFIFISFSKPIFQNSYSLFVLSETLPTYLFAFVKSNDISLVTQSMMQRRPNPMELRSIDSYIQILCRFQKSKRKVPPSSPPQ